MKFVIAITYIEILELTSVSKDTFQRKPARQKSSRIPLKDIHEFIQTVSKTGQHSCNYSSLLIYLFSEAGITICLENLLKMKSFAHAMFSTVDARLIVLYTEKS